MHPDIFSSLALSRHRFHLRALAPTPLPPFLGSTLRGAFGHALKEAVCVMEHRDCARCLVAERCIYAYLFETPVPLGLPLLRGQRQAPHPFVLIAPACDRPNQSEEVLFDLLLLGRAVECRPYVVFAAGEMARRGLGVARARFELAEVLALDERGSERLIYSAGARRLAADGPAKSLCDFVRARLEQLPEARTLKLRFLTPARIRVEGDLQAGLGFELLARNLPRRVSLLAAVHGCAPLELDFRALIALAGRVEARASALRWQDWERYSNRQQTKMKLGGLVGEIEYAGEAIREFLPLVVAGELLHVGAGTSFGLGRYEIL
jgi:hypothetical protein